MNNEITLEYIDGVIKTLVEAPVPPRVPLMIPECYRHLVENEDGSIPADIQIIPKDYWRV